VIGVAGGPGKYDVVRAALRGHLVDVLITDHSVAEQLMQEARRNTALEQIANV
jgi:DNA-binding transcriptional regulator LsrR (DeoR family)